MSMQGKPADLFLVFTARLETRPKAFRSYSFIKHSRNEAFRHFLVNLSNGYDGNDDRYKNLDFGFGYVFPSSMTVQSFITIKWKEKSYQWSKFSNFLFLTTFRKIYSFFNTKRQGLILKRIKGIGVLVLPGEKRKVATRDYYYSTN